VVRIDQAAAQVTGAASGLGRAAARNSYLNGGTIRLDAGLRMMPR
jgi:NADP-dependent 3-hydroxy acid dehydrogenase YdfG